MRRIRGFFPEGVLVYVPHENNLVPFIFLFTDLVADIFQEGLFWADIPASLRDISELLVVY